VTSRIVHVTLCDGESNAVNMLLWLNQNILYLSRVYCVKNEGIVVPVRVIKPLGLIILVVLFLRIGTPSRWLMLHFTTLTREIYLKLIRLKQL